MPIQIIWGDDLNASSKFIEKIISQNVTKEWKEINVSQLNGEHEEEVTKAMEEILTPPLGEGSRVVILKNNPIFTLSNENSRIQLEKIYKNIPNENYFIMQNRLKPDARLKSTKFIKKLIKEGLAIEVSFSLPDVWDYEGQKKYLYLIHLF